MDQAAKISHSPRTGMESHWAVALIPFVFVLCWASGFVVPRAFQPYSEPLTFVALRSAGAFVLLALIAIGHPWPRKLSDIAGLLWSGALLQGFSVALMYWSIYHGVPAGIAALIGGLQPAITAVLASGMLGEALGGAQWTGIVTGLAGVALVVSPKLHGGSSAGTIELMVLCFLGVASIAMARSIRSASNKLATPGAAPPSCLPAPSSPR